MSSQPTLRYHGTERGSTTDSSVLRLLRKPLSWQRGAWKTVLRYFLDSSRWPAAQQPGQRRLHCGPGFDRNRRPAQLSKDEKKRPCGRSFSRHRERIWNGRNSPICWRALRAAGGFMVLNWYRGARRGDLPAGFFSPSTAARCSQGLMPRCFFTDSVAQHAREVHCPRPGSASCTQASEGQADDFSPLAAITASITSSRSEASFLIRNDKLEVQHCCCICCHPTDEQRSGVVVPDLDEM
ncbi:hypothetical protein ACCO45_005824 [Purpureocillium lilacinum]|uniref:Uncharacterized protein n=1 Tax=Purpureocillium lilacinum TaxID=33203 RepID=A0ACC4DXQ9_PURLI